MPKLRAPACLRSVHIDPAPRSLGRSCSLCWILLGYRDHRRIPDPAPGADVSTGDLPRSALTSEQRPRLTIASRPLQQLICFTANRATENGLSHVPSSSSAGDLTTAGQVDAYATPTRPAPGNASSPPGAITLDDVWLGGGLVMPAAPLLIGRAAELQAVTAALAAAANDGGPNTILVTGPGGSGTSALTRIVFG